MTSIRAMADRRIRAGLVLASWVIVLAVVALLPQLGLGDYWVRQIVLICLLALVVSGLNLSYGYAGELALGQTALYAAGAYTGGYTAEYITNDLLLAIVLAVVSAAILGLISGIPGLRLGGWTLAIASFFLVLLIPAFVHMFGDRLGGDVGMIGIPQAEIFGRLLSNSDFYLVVVLATGVCLALFRNIVTSRHGTRFRVLRESPVLAGALGWSPYATKLTSYTLAAVPAGVAGALFAYLDSYIAPQSFGLDFAIAVLAASIFGGSTSIYGIVLGAAVLQLGPESATSFQDYAVVAYGALLVIGGLLLKNGVAGLVNRYIRGPLLRRVLPAETVGEGQAMTPVGRRPLRVEHISRAFGGIKAVADVSFSAQPGQVTALIGPNGSGKTTMMNLISGYYRADQGTVWLGDENVTSLPPHRIARRGVGRTFQTPLVPAGLTVREVVMSGAFYRNRLGLLAAALRLPRHWRVARIDRANADAVMRALGLAKRAGESADSLALGTRRILELARAGAGGASVLLLDEVASGLDESEIHDLVDAIKRVRDAGTTVLLVEHNFALVRSLADVVVVLADGRLVTEGTPAEIERHPEVIERYLGAGAGISGTRTGSRSPQPAQVTSESEAGYV